MIKRTPVFLAALALSIGSASAECRCPTEAIRYTTISVDAAVDSDTLRKNFRLLEERARRGDVAAMRLAGLWMAQGIGTPLDYKRAYHWLWRAANLGDAIARNVVGEVAKRLTPDERRDARYGQLNRNN